MSSSVIKESKNFSHLMEKNKALNLKENEHLRKKRFVIFLQKAVRRV